VCETCVAKAGTYLHEPISVADLLQRSHAILRGARRVVSPSHDAAARMARHFPGLSPIVIPHEDDAAIEDPPPIPVVSGTVRICIAGAIGLHKGYDVLLACARDARKRKLELEFVVAGTTTNDERLMDTGRVFVTGPYRPDEAIALIRAQDAALALLPSIWPETWCLGLTELLRAGLRVAAFDTGAPAERIRRTGRGFLLPLGLPAGAINDTLLNAARGRSFLPIRRSSAYKPSTLMQP
jgi:glycosyltransferase involved in cell wall biosynthesis